jgi:N-methylhydantoinase A
VPAHSGAFSALGCLVSPLRYDAVQTHRARLDAWDGKLIEDRFRSLEEQCLRPILDEGHAASAVTVQRSLDVRYVGQNYEIELPFLRDPAGLRAAFEARHRQLYGYATGESVECVNLRVTAQLVDDDVVLPPPAVIGPARPAGELRAYFREAGEVAMPRYERSALPPGQVVTGPALVEDEWSTTLVYPGQRCRADHLGNMIIEVEGSRSS